MAQIMVMCYGLLVKLLCGVTYIWYASMKQKTITLEAAKQAEEILKNLENRRPREVSQTRVVRELRGQIQTLFAKGWTEQGICDELKVVMPGLTPEAIRAASKGAKSEIQSCVIQSPTTQTDVTLLSEQPPTPRPPPLRRM